MLLQKPRIVEPPLLVLPFFPQDLEGCSGMDRLQCSKPWTLERDKLKFIQSQDDHTASSAAEGKKGHQVDADYDLLGNLSGKKLLHFQRKGGKCRGCLKKNQTEHRALAPGWGKVFRAPLWGHCCKRLADVRASPQAFFFFFLNSFIHLITWSNYVFCSLLLNQWNASNILDLLKKETFCSKFDL